MKVYFSKLFLFFETIKTKGPNCHFHLKVRFTFCFQFIFTRIVNSHSLSSFSVIFLQTFFLLRCYLLSPIQFVSFIRDIFPNKQTKSLWDNIYIFASLSTKFFTICGTCSLYIIMRLKE